MAKKSSRFKSVVRYTESREEQAAQKLADSQRHLSDQQQRLNSLSQFRDEYAQQFTQVGRQGMGASQLRDYQAFLAKLDNAVKQQERMVEVAVSDVETRKRVWLNTRNETRKANTLLDRYLYQEQRQEDRREQKDSDERAQRMVKRES